jgi:hypothetical protein
MCCAEGGPPSFVVYRQHDSKKDYIENRLNYKLYIELSSMMLYVCHHPKNKEVLLHSNAIDKDQTLFLWKTKEKREAQSGRT